MKHVFWILLIGTQVVSAKDWSDRDYALGKTSFFLAAAGPETSPGVRRLYYYDRIKRQQELRENTDSLNLETYNNGKVKAFLGVDEYIKNSPLKRFPRASEFLKAAEQDPFLKKRLNQLFGTNSTTLLQGLKPTDGVVVYAGVSILRPLVIDLNQVVFQISETPKGHQNRAISSKRK